jgi:hypothetical protein
MEEVMNVNIAAHLGQGVKKEVVMTVSIAAHLGQGEKEVVLPETNCLLSDEQCKKQQDNWLDAVVTVPVPFVVSKFGKPVLEAETKNARFLPDANVWRSVTNMRAMSEAKAAAQTAPGQAFVTGVWALDKFGNVIDWTERHTHMVTTAHATVMSAEFFKGACYMLVLTPSDMTLLTGGPDVDETMPPEVQQDKQLSTQWLIDHFDVPATCLVTPQPPRQPDGKFVGVVSLEAASCLESILDAHDYSRVETTLMFDRLTIVVKIYAILVSA